MEKSIDDLPLSRDGTRIGFNKHYDVFDITLPDHKTIYMSKERFISFADFIEFAKKMFLGEGILTFMGKPLTDYHCPCCGGKELIGEHGSDYFTCTNCGKMPLERLRVNRRAQNDKN